MQLEYKKFSRKSITQSKASWAKHPTAAVVIRGLTEGQGDSQESSAPKGNPKRLLRCAILALMKKTAQNKTRSSRRATLDDFQFFVDPNLDGERASTAPSPREHVVNHAFMPPH